MRLYVFILPLFFSSFYYSQKTIYTSIQSNKTNFQTKDFYFDHVIDNRINKENIGFIYKSSLTYKHPANFHKTLPQEFLNFFRATYPNQKSLHRVLLKVNVFEISHLLSENKIDTGRVKANFDFYLLENDSAFFLYNFTNVINDYSDRITYSHPNRMKRILIQSASPLDTAVLKQGSFAFNLGKVADSIRVGSPSLNKRDLMFKDSIAREKQLPSEYFVLLGVSSNFSLQHVLEFVNGDILFRLKKHPSWLVGPGVEILFYQRFFNSELPINVSYSLKNINISMRALHQIHKDLFFNLQALTVLGKEYYTIDSQKYTKTNNTYKAISSNKDSETIYGFEMCGGVYLIPANKQNFFAGLDVFYRYTSSSRLGAGAGIKINIGFKF